MNKNWLKEKAWEKLFQRDNLIVLVLSGILLFIIALPTKDGKVEGDKTAEQTLGGLFHQEAVRDSAKGEEREGGMALPVGEDEFDYVTYLEERLEKMLGGVDGVGKVSVMITLNCSEELVLEKDRPISQSNIQETDAQGGSRTTSQVETMETTIYSTEGSDSNPYVIKKLLPQVEGVLVVAQGAGMGRVNKNITEIVQALFEVEAHKIKVVPMEQNR